MGISPMNRKVQHGGMGFHVGGYRPLRPGPSVSTTAINIASFSTFEFLVITPLESYALYIDGLHFLHCVDEKEGGGLGFYYDLFSTIFKFELRLPLPSAPLPYTFLEAKRECPMAVNEPFPLIIS